MIPFSQNLIWWSGNYPYHDIRKECKIWLSDMTNFPFFVFSFSYQKTKLLISFFFRFRVTWLGNRARKNLPIDSEIRILIFLWSYGLLYIIWKRTLRGTQKYAFHENLMIMVEVTVIFRFEWSKWLFSTKITKSAHVTYY